MIKNGWVHSQGPIHQLMIPKLLDEAQLHSLTLTNCIISCPSNKTWMKLTDVSQLTTPDPYSIISLYIKRIIAPYFRVIWIKCLTQWFCKTWLRPLSYILSSELHKCSPWKVICKFLRRLLSTLINDWMKTLLNQLCDHAIMLPFYSTSLHPFLSSFFCSLHKKSFFFIWP